MTIVIMMMIIMLVMRKVIIQFIKKNNNNCDDDDDGDIGSRPDNYNLRGWLGIKSQLSLCFIIIGQAVVFFRVLQFAQVSSIFLNNNY